MRKKEAEEAEEEGTLMPDGDNTNPEIVSGYKILTEVRSVAAEQRAMIGNLSDHLMRFHAENREDHQDIFRGLRQHGERITANATEIGNIKPKVSHVFKAVNGTAREQIGMRAEWKTWAVILGFAAAAGLGVLVTKLFGG